MRKRYLVCYDISDDKRLQRIRKKMLGYGDPIQYSVFICLLSDVERVQMLDELHRLIHHAEDRVLIADLGNADHGVADQIEFIGRSPVFTERLAAIII